MTCPDLHNIKVGQQICQRLMAKGVSYLMSGHLYRYGRNNYNFLAVIVTPAPLLRQNNGSTVQFLRYKIGHRTAYTRLIWPYDHSN